MGLLDAILNALAKGLKPLVEPPRGPKWHERYPGLGPLRWWDKLGPDEHRCRACGHTTRTWRGTQGPRFWLKRKGGTQPRNDRPEIT